MNGYGYEGYGYEDEGYGYEDEGYGGDGPIIEQTSSTESHYELMAILSALAKINGVLVSIQDILLKDYEASEAARARANGILDQHEISVTEYMKTIEQPLPINPYPFASVPAGTDVRDLPDGGRLFTMADGTFLQVGPDLGMFFIDNNGNISKLKVEEGSNVRLPSGTSLELASAAGSITDHESGISGLSSKDEVSQVGDGRYSVTLQDGIRLEFSHTDQSLVAINPNGTLLVIEKSNIKGIGDEVDVRVNPDGAKSFATKESRIRGMIRPDGSIELVLPNGLDLGFKYPDGVGADDNSEYVPEHFVCEDNCS